MSKRAVGFNKWGILIVVLLAFALYVFIAVISTQWGCGYNYNTHTYATFDQAWEWWHPVLAVFLGALTLILLTWDRATSEECSRCAMLRSEVESLKSHTAMLQSALIEETRK